MLNFKEFITEENKTTSEWMSGHELAKHIPKTAIKHIQQSKEHNILTNHDLAHGGSGNLHYRIHTKSYGDYKTHTVQAASSQEDKDGFTHHVSYDIIRNSAKAHSHMKTNANKKITVPFHKKVDSIKEDHVLTFKNFVTLNEYLTPKQKQKTDKNNVSMSPEARKNTDHFFGEGNDIKKEDIINYEHDKSEIHKKVEQHINQSLSHEEYASGITKDKYGRDTKIGRMIKDEKLRNEFASDNARSGSKSVKKPYMSVVRGVHVMGQTNPEPDDIHPTGHAWKEESCKNIKNGSNKHYLKQEVKHGTVVVFGHDHDGKEIYRATLQPHVNDQKHVVYGLDGQYGIKHPSFTKHAEDVASRLSGEHKGGSLLYKKHSYVYNDTGTENMLHPNATPDQISKALDDKHWVVRQVAIQHPKATSEQISKALDDKEPGVRHAAIQHPNATSEHVTEALNDKNPSIRLTAIQHPNATSEHVSKALEDGDPSVRQAAIQHPNATQEHFNKALNDEHPIVRGAAIKNPKATSEHISKALKDERSTVREAAIRNPNATSDHISKALKDEDWNVRQAAIKHPKATSEHISKALKDENSNVREAAVQHPKATSEHISKALNDESWDVRRAAITHPNATSEHISKVLNDDRDWLVRRAAITHPNATSEHVSKALEDEDPGVRQAAVQHPNATSEHISKALKDEDPNVRTMAVRKQKQNKV